MSSQSDGMGYPALPLVRLPYVCFSSIPKKSASIWKIHQGNCSRVWERSTTQRINCLSVDYNTGDVYAVISGGIFRYKGGKEEFVDVVPASSPLIVAAVRGTPVVFACQKERFPVGNATNQHWAISLVFPPEKQGKTIVGGECCQNMFFCVVRDDVVFYPPLVIDLSQLVVGGLRWLTDACDFISRPPRFFRYDRTRKKLTVFITVEKPYKRETGMPEVRICSGCPTMVEKTIGGVYTNIDVLTLPGFATKGTVSNNVAVGVIESSSRRPASLVAIFRHLTPAWKWVIDGTVEEICVDEQWVYILSSPPPSGAFTWKDKLIHAFAPSGNSYEYIHTFVVCRDGINTVTKGYLLEANNYQERAREEGVFVHPIEAGEYTITPFRPPDVSFPLNLTFAGEDE